MDHLHGRVALPVDSLRERWRARSTDGVWLRPGDWYHPAVDAVVEALLDERDVTPAAERLGGARGEVGVGVGEAMDDVACLYREHGHPPDHAVLRAVAVGWSEANDALAVAPSVVDAESGLATAQYLGHRLQETYGAAARTGEGAGETHGLVVVDVALDGLTGWQRIARSAAMGRALTQTFGDDRPMAALGNGTFVVLAERGIDDRRLDDGRLGDELRRRIERTGKAYGVSGILRRPPRVWLESLPSSHAGALALLDRLRR